MCGTLLSASLDQFSEYEHLERILLDAVCTNPVDYELTADVESEAQRTDKYHPDHYTPEPHYPAGQLNDSTR